MTIHFDSSIIKITKKGARVISSTLEKGEKLADGRTYAEVAGGIFPTAEAPETGGLTLDPATNSSVPIGEGPSGAQTHADDLAGNDGPVTTGLTTDETVTHTAAAEKVSGNAPSESDGKQEWFDYAVSKGFGGEYDDVTKKQLIAQYGA